jgi:hypothetical protein
MFGLSKPKLPVSEEEKAWIDASFLRLAKILGAHRLLKADVILPNADYFPDPFDQSEAALDSMFRRVAGYMQVDPASVDVTLYATAYDRTRTLTPFYEGKNSGAAGLYHHDPDVKAHISIDEGQLKDPTSLVATLAHELGHVILLRPGLVARESEDMEPLNDLLTVFLGFGVFTANSAFRFEQHSDYRSQGWSAKRQGYLSERQFGYALARFACERRENKPLVVLLVHQCRCVYEALVRTAC